MTDAQFVSVLVVFGVVCICLTTVACVAIRAASHNNASAWRASERERRDRDAQIQVLIEKASLRPSEAAEKHWRERAAHEAAQAEVDRAKAISWAQAQRRPESDTFAEHAEDVANE